MTEHTVESLKDLIFRTAQNLSRALGITMLQDPRIVQPIDKLSNEVCKKLLGMKSVNTNLDIRHNQDKQSVDKYKECFRKIIKIDKYHMYERCLYCSECPKNECKLDTEIQKIANEALQL